MFVLINTCNTRKESIRKGRSYATHNISTVSAQVKYGFGWHETDDPAAVDSGISGRDGASGQIERRGFASFPFQEYLLSLANDHSFAVTIRQPYGLNVPRTHARLDIPPYRKAKGTSSTSEASYGPGTRQISFSGCE